MDMISNPPYPLPSQALAGEVGMSSELDDVARSLYNGSIPAIWRRLAPDTLKSLGNWMLHFRRRFEQYETWVCNSAHSRHVNPLHNTNRYG